MAMKQGTVLHALAMTRGAMERVMRLEPRLTQAMLPMHSTITRMLIEGSAAESEREKVASTIAVEGRIKLV